MIGEYLDLSPIR